MTFGDKGVHKWMAHLNDLLPRFTLPSQFPILIKSWLVNELKLLWPTFFWVNLKFKEANHRAKNRITIDALGGTFVSVKVLVERDIDRLHRPPSHVDMSDEGRVVAQGIFVAVI